MKLIKMRNQYFFDVKAAPRCAVHHASTAPSSSILHASAHCGRQAHRRSSSASRDTAVGERVGGVVSSAALAGCQHGALTAPGFEPRQKEVVVVVDGSPIRHLRINFLAQRKVVKR